MERKVAEKFLHNMCDERAEAGLGIVAGHQKNGFPTTFAVYESPYVRALAVLVADLLTRVDKLEKPTVTIYGSPNNATSIPFAERGIQRNDKVRIFQKLWRVDHVDGSWLFLSNDDNEVQHVQCNAVTLVTPYDARVEDIISQV